MATATRCSWAQTPLSIAYHDTEWGVPVHDDQTLFEFLKLEGAQAVARGVRAAGSSPYDLLDANRDALVQDPAFRGTGRPPGTVYDGARAGGRDGYAGFVRP